MATVGGNIIPALPLNASVPPSPRSDVSGTTEQSRDTDGSLDRASTIMTQLSSTPHIPSRVKTKNWKILINDSYLGYLTLRESFLRVDGGIEDKLLDLQERMELHVQPPLHPQTQQYLSKTLRTITHGLQTQYHILLNR